MKGPEANDRCSPLPRRTGHGDFPHPALARAVSSRTHSQLDQSQMVQVSIQADTLPTTPAPLAATAQALAQPIPHEVIELAKWLTRIAQAEVVGPPSHSADSPARSTPAGAYDSDAVRSNLAAIPVPAPSPGATVPGSSIVESDRSGLGQTERCSPRSPGSDPVAANPQSGSCPG